MEILQLLELVNNPEIAKGMAKQLANAVPVSELLIGGSNPFIPDYSSCKVPIIKQVI